eukprot:TRINITY_DN7245_c0_g2_i1.p1 TRINITY_DN7245_c0_g2~~TRINITY_DN7245_c0_g2_i1.p1  ORF type:complete len:401 (+),score=157.67 TRINITY_DN7245_c0_g2_i1:73-1203(+)
MAHREALVTPCYVLDKAVAQRNATAMLDRAAALGCALRPHVKTHKTLEGALLQTGGRRSGIVVSTLAEAEYFADGGFDDILYAVCITPEKFLRVEALVGRLGKMHIAVDQAGQLERVVKYLEGRKAAAPDAFKKWSVCVMVDCGYHREGLDPDLPESLALVQQIAVHGELLEFFGIYTHGGNSYDARSAEEVRRYAVAERDAVSGFAAKIRGAGLDVPVVGVGSTPTCSHPPADGLGGVTEMHPGNYITYDAMQCAIGACGIEDVAVRVLTRIVAVYPHRKTILIDLGWTGCSCQGADHHYGVLTSHPELQVRVFKQESGEVEAKPGVEVDWAKYQVGDVLELAPWHSCAAGAAHPTVVIEEGGEQVGEWVPCRGW